MLREHSNSTCYSIKKNFDDIQVTVNSDDEELELDYVDDVDQDDKNGSINQEQTENNHIDS